MPVEIEAKLRVADLAAVRMRLREAGAKRRGSVLELNSFFDTPSAALLAADRGLRLRRTVDLATGARAAILTHKGPLRPGEFKTREEHELIVPDADEAAAAEFLGSLGYTIQLSFEKRRESWSWGDCKIELDELPGGLGTFVEIEGPGEASVMRVRDAIGLGAAESVKQSYIAMVAAHLRGAAPARQTLAFTP